MEQLALKFPAGFRARLRAVAVPGESMTAAIIRAVDALERSGVPTAGEARDAILIRLDDLDARLRAVEAGAIQPEGEGVLTELDSAGLEHNAVTETAVADPEHATGDKYPRALWARALELQQAGVKLKDAREQLIQEFGSAPAAGNLSTRARQKLGMTGALTTL